MDMKNDYVRDFLYSTANIVEGNGRITTSILMDDRMEGWIGIPHGGISMAIIMDLAMALETYPKRDEDLFPVSADFRLAGASARIGDTLHFEVSATQGGAEGVVSVDEVDTLPYMSASIRYHSGDSPANDPFHSFLPAKDRDVMDYLSPLPFYRKCFVCGVERVHPGLRRQFHSWEAPGGIIVSPAGFEGTDRDSFYRFERQGMLHPLGFLALLDETLGWGGFLLAGNGAVTVRISYTFHRPVAAGERLIFFGRGDRIRGKADSRLLFWASGGAAAVHDDGTLEPVVSSSGQWYCLRELTEQMKTALLPKELMHRAFDLARP